MEEVRRVVVRIGGHLDRLEETINGIESKVDQVHACIWNEMWNAQMATHHQNSQIEKVAHSTQQVKACVEHMKGALNDLIAEVMVVRDEQSTSAEEQQQQQQRPRESWDRAAAGSSDPAAARAWYGPPHQPVEVLNEQAGHPEEVEERTEPPAEEPTEPTEQPAVVNQAPASHPPTGSAEEAWSTGME